MLKNIRWKTFPRDFFVIQIGFLLYGLSIALAIRANLGTGTWAVLDVALSQITGLTPGTLTVLVGFAVLISALLMREQGSGSIINLCSIYGVTAPDQRIYQRDGEPAQFKPVYYTVTKAGILGLTKYLAAYYGDQHIRVNALTPGGVYNGHDEAFLRAYAARSIMGRMAKKDEMNGALLFLASDASE